MSTLTFLNMTISPQDPVLMSDLLRNKTAFLRDLQKVTNISPEIISLLMNMELPSSSLELLLTSEIQNLVNLMLQMIRILYELMNKLMPSVNVLLEYVESIRNLNLASSSEARSLSSIYPQLVREKRSTISSKGNFDTISKAMCTKGMLSLFGISNMPVTSNSDPATQGDAKIEELIDKFNIPRNASMTQKSSNSASILSAPYCMSFYLEMVNTTAGAVAWAFVKPMLLGRILYTPDTPLTREIIQKVSALMHHNI
ncbi:hypothetical protein Z043_109488 [Scleropages formosus]|uniref:Uncharacterized protein n=1 Tax=Scleropages formosus TaxID=113540 RepID=A0A0P7UPU3_SCLFO|nr:hypothetical protein Z043_109488 [Scleropages formosus]